MIYPVRWVGKNNQAVTSSSGANDGGKKAKSKEQSKKKKTYARHTQNKHTKLLGNTCLPACLRVSSNNSPLHHPSSGVSVTAIISPAWKSNSSSIVAA